MFEQVADRRQVLDELRRRIAGVGAKGERVGPALRPVPQEPVEAVVGSGHPPAGQVLAEPGGPVPVPAPEVPVGPPPATAGVFAVPEPLGRVLPQGGLPRGGVVSLAGGTGSTSLLLSLLATPVGAWSALVGLPEVGFAAAAEFGVDLDRTVLVPDPGPDALQVLSVLADGVDLLVLGHPDTMAITPARTRVLTGRLRQRGCTLLVAGDWPGADLVLRTRVTGWSGIGQGRGRLRDRTLEIQVSGRRAAGPGREVSVLLQGDREQVRMVADPAVAAAAARPTPVMQPDRRAVGT